GRRRGSRRSAATVSRRHLAMTRRFWLLALLAAALLIPTAPRPAAAAPKTLKLATIVPAGSVWDKELQHLDADVQKRTEGRIVLRVYPGGVAGDDPDVVRK